MQNDFKPIPGTFSNLGGATLHKDGNSSNLGVSTPKNQRSFAFSETTAHLLSFCVELDMLVEDLDLTVKDITNDETPMEKITMDVVKIKDIILTKFLVPNIEMNLGSRDNIGKDTILV